MLYKKFGTDIYQKIAPEYKTYQTDNGKETLLISKNYTVLKQGKLTFFIIREKFPSKKSSLILISLIGYSW
jgi:hypothetical protein